MKHIITFILLTLLCTKTISACVYSSFSIWPPPQTTISTSPVFVITMKGINFTDSIRAKKSFFFASKNDTVFFEILDTFQGDYSHFQVIVKPEKRLTNNSVYSFECDSLMLKYRGHMIYDKFPREYINKNRYHLITTWKTNNFIKSHLPSTPSIKYKKNKYRGKWTSCSQLVSIFKLKHNDTIPIIYKLTLTRKGKKRSFFILPHEKNGLLYISNDMMGISPYKWYEISLEAMNSKGNYSLPSTPKKYHTPYVKAILLSLSYAISF
jgi:hypothetical protein